MKSTLFLTIAISILGQSCRENQNSNTMELLSPQKFTTFSVNNNTEMYRVSFKNQYDMNLVGHLFISNDLDRNQKHAAVIIGHPMGAVKEQSADVYASNLAERGFVTLAIDLSYWGESINGVRNAISPDMFTESFQAAVDFLGTCEFVDQEKIGVLGICGSGGFVISAAKIDPRMKAIATVSMYDMGSVTRNGYNKSQNVEQRKTLIAQSVEQRNEEFRTKKQIYRNYLPIELPENADSVTAMYHNFYRTERGIHIPEGRTLETTQNRTLAGEVKFMNFYPFNDIETISPRPMLFITGDKAHSKEFSQDAYQRAEEPKELYYVKNANHVDLYDRTEIIPFNKLELFFKTFLN